MPTMPTFSAAPAARVVIGRRAPSAAVSGVLAMLPLLAPYVSFALVIGSVVAAHGSALAGWSGSWLIFGGSAHLAAVRTLDQAGPVAAILTGLLINARLVVYGASFARQWSDQPRWFRVAAAALIIDPTWAVAERNLGRFSEARDRRRFFAAAGLTLGTAWSGGIAFGALAGARLDARDLEIVIPLCLLGLVGAGLRTGPTRLVMVVSAVTALVTIAWPSGTGLLVAVVAGSVAGSVHEGRSTR